MFIGVFFYSFTIGSISSILQNLDTRTALYEKKLNTLLLLKRKYKLDTSLYSRIKKALKYGIKKTDEDRKKFLNDLPMNLRIDLSNIMHENLVKDIAYFEHVSKRFIAFIGPDLRPIRVGKNEYIVKEGEYAHESKLFSVFVDC